MARTCEVVPETPLHPEEKLLLRVTRFDVPRPEDGCRYELVVVNVHGETLLTADLTQVFARMLEAEIAARKEIASEG